VAGDGQAESAEYIINSTFHKVGRALRWLFTSAIRKFEDGSQDLIELILRRDLVKSIPIGNLQGPLHRHFSKTSQNRLNGEDTIRI
jgi:hypothetical protein